MTYEQLLQRLDAGKIPDLGDVLGNAFELYKKTWLHGFLYVLLSFILVAPALLIIYFPILGAAIFDAQGYDPADVIESMPAISIISMTLLFLVVMIFVQAIVMALQAGLYRLFAAAEKGEEVKAGILFTFLKGRYLGKTFLLSLIAMLIALLATAMCVLPVIYVSVPIYFFAAVFAFHPDFSAGQIVRAAFRLGNKTWIVSFVLIILSSLIAQMVGFLACGVGVLFTSAFVYMTIYNIYKGVVSGGDEGGEPGINIGTNV
ncbi:hypothetical protein E7Z59_00365 [Robertkochia marina]|uniref:DUF4013 domain-containing protein n=1 Tax=Robertkochia marina TaxID=1227945 RepID=A0A4S3M3U5_9FLAO|nr:hypothetical protein [Robertkochia marina]THD68817.1 hypothetical protein E7Z59_00365 [Robertkochia marina]TRZ43891.1 hypothetical protein D3A96_10020 [Robertkochia marina]